MLASFLERKAFGFKWRLGKQGGKDAEGPVVQNIFPLWSKVISCTLRFELPAASVPLSWSLFGMLLPPSQSPICYIPFLNKGTLGEKSVLCARQPGSGTEKAEKGGPAAQTPVQGSLPSQRARLSIQSRPPKWWLQSPWQANPSLPKGALHQACDR